MLDEFWIIVIPNGAFGTNENLHHRTERAELQPARKKLLFGDADVASRIRPPHRKVDCARPQRILQRDSQAAERAARVAIPNCRVFASGVVRVAREFKIFVMVGSLEAFCGQLRHQYCMQVFHGSRHFIFLAAVDFVPSHALANIQVQFAFEPVVDLRPAQIGGGPLSVEEIALRQPFLEEPARASICDPQSEVHSAIVEVANHFRRIGERRIEIHVPPAVFSAAVRPVKPHDACGDVEAAQAVGVLNHFLLRIHGVSQVFMIVIAPPDAVESPNGRHHRRAGNCVVLVQYVAVGRSINHVVCELPILESRSRSYPIARRCSGLAQQSRRRPRISRSVI